MSLTLGSIFVLFSVPILIYGLDVFERIYGSAKAGWVATFPIVGGPAMLILTIEHGTAFGSTASYNASIGMVSWLAFILCYRFSNDNPKWMVILISIVAWGLIGWFLTSFHLSDYLLFGILITLIINSFKFGRVIIGTKKSNASLLYMRIFLAVTLVLLVIYLGQVSGERLSGLLITFPIVSASLLLPVFIYGERNRVHQMTSGMLIAGPSLATFMICLYFFLAANTTIFFSFIFTFMISVVVQILMLKLVMRFNEWRVG